MGARLSDCSGIHSTDQGKKSSEVSELKKAHAEQNRARSKAAGLEAELRGMSFRELVQRAQAMGVADEQLDAAADAPAVIACILEKATKATVPKGAKRRKRKSSKRRSRKRTKRGYTKLQAPKKQKRTSRLRTRKRTKRSKSKSQK